MAISSRRYLLASGDVVTTVGFKCPRRRLPWLPRCKPTAVTTASSGGISFEISPLENSHDLLWYMSNTNSLVSIQRYFSRGIQQGGVQKKISISLHITKASRQICSTALRSYSNNRLTYHKTVSAHATARKQGYSTRSNGVD